MSQDSPGSTPPKAGRGRRLAIGCAASLLGVVLVLFLLFQVFDKDLPEGETGPAAEAFAQAMMAAVDIDAWNETGAVTWDFGGRQQHLWDRERGFAQVTWGTSTVLLDLSTRQGLAYEDGELQEEAAAAPMLLKAWSFWCNDSFWLNPVAKLFDEGTERAVVTGADGREDLLITYSSGGVTPGDSYLWTFDEQGLPTSWQMWTQILPLGGITASWEEWITLETGARIATRHDIGVLDLRLSSVSGAQALGELIPGEDPFAPLVAALP